ncbi:MAG: fructose-6-phosphate aldolase [Deltaproteobacteria bacterium]|nr:fructose-6-phosphate aldolase [Deltaproteobacteria bacterium]MBM4323771.1 fructose-6-phosphate aldolase [Deltaproteobacteria bacterium]MBM4346857.1 fructose-6-phosphate aldolase [Deltaproteobacteria bacterium]
MKIFIDTANLNEIKKAKALGLVDGVTTNPTLLAKEGEDAETLIRKISKEVKGPVNVEVTGITCEEIVKEAKVLATWGDEIVIKIPINQEGLKAVRILSTEGIQTNVTLLFSASQAILAAKAGATYICPFIGRLDDISFNGLELIQQIREIYDQYDEIETRIIVASVRNPIHVIEVARMGAEIVTIPPAILDQMAKHPLTDKGIAQFLEDAKKIGSKK